MRPLPFTARFLRAIRSQPALTPLPVCSACARQVQPRDFGREHCKACEAERAEASAYWQAQIDATLSDARTPPAEPMFGSDEAAKPFLPDDED